MHSTSCQCRSLAVLLFVIVLSAGSVAEPWINPGDEQLRHHIQLLADIGVIKVPITTWPLMWGSIGEDIARVEPKSLTDAQFWSLAYVRFAHMRSNGGGEQSSWRLTWHNYASNTPPVLTDFSVPEREEDTTTLQSDWLGSRFAVNLTASYVKDPQDNKTVRFDGSYAAMIMGNWSLSVGAIDRWWGPSWQNNLLLSSNARPVPGIALQRNYSDAFDTPWLRWLGPWQWVTFVGQLESERAIPKAKFFGSRLTVRPLPALELGFNRVAQWGGSDQDENLDAFLDVLRGDGDDSDEVDLGREANNQLEGVDWRLSGHLAGRYTLAWYGQFINDVNDAGSAKMLLSGIEFAFSDLHQHTRGYIEIMDSGADGYKDSLEPNRTYEHHVYQNGYRFRGRAIAASTDNDSRMLSLGVDRYLSNSGQLSLRISRVELYREGSGDSYPENTGLIQKEEDLTVKRFSYSHIIGSLKYTLGITSVEKDENSAYEGESGAYVEIDYRLH